MKTLRSYVQGQWHEATDGFREQLYTRLKAEYQNLVLDVVFTQDEVWADRSVNAD